MASSDRARAGRPHAGGRSRLSVAPATVALGATLLLGPMLGCGMGSSEPTPSGTSMVAEWGTGDAGANEAPEITSLHFVPQRAVPGETVQAVANARDPDGDPVTLRYEWRVGSRRLMDEGSRITVPESATWDSVEVVVVASDGKDESEPRIGRFRAGNRAPRITALDIDTIEVAGARGTIEPHWRVVATVVDTDRNDTSVDYEWIVNGEVVEQSTDLFSKRRVARGDEVRVRGTPFDGQSHGPTLESPPFVIGNAPPEIVSSPPGLDATGTFRYTPEIHDGDAEDRFRFALLRGPDGMEIDPETGLLVWTPTAADVGSHPVELQVSDAFGGRSRQKFAVSVQVGGPASAGPAARP